MPPVGYGRTITSARVWRLAAGGITPMQRLALAAWLHFCRLLIKAEGLLLHMSALYVHCILKCRGLGFGKLDPIDIGSWSVDMTTKSFPKGLDARMRDKDGEIRQKRSDTKVGTLRKTYGPDFARGYRSDAHLGTVLKGEGVDSLNQLLKKITDESQWIFLGAVGISGL